MSDVVPFDRSVWWDVESTTVDVLAVLRLTETDVDADRIRGLVPVVGQEINRRRDSPDPLTAAEVPVELDQALTYGVVELYRAKESPPVNVDDFSLASGYLRTDPLQSVRTLIDPHQKRWGVG